MSKGILTQKEVDGLPISRSGMSPLTGASLNRLLDSHALLLAESDRLKGLLCEATMECREHNSEYGHVTDLESFARWEQACAGQPEPPFPGKPALFRTGKFTASSGQELDWKIECNALTDADLATIAEQLASLVGPFNRIVGVPDGGLRLAKAMEKYAQPSDEDTGLQTLLVVDDVLTTGASIQAVREMFHCPTKGAVIFARGPCPPWVTPLFTLTGPPQHMDLDSAKKFLLNTIEWLGKPGAPVTWPDVAAAIRTICYRPSDARLDLAYATGRLHGLTDAMTDPGLRAAQAEEIADARISEHLLLCPACSNRGRLHMNECPRGKLLIDAGQ